MDTSPATGGGGSAPFLLKTYDMVDDSSTDEIVSWSNNEKSFIVWNPPEFARILLPTYFKHNNFSSFIRQLNTYGFRKIDPEQWEFANDDFVKGQKHLLKNIHRRKPVHSHSNPQGSLVDPERTAFEEEIDRLSREKASLEADVLRSKQQRSVEKLQMEELSQRIGGMEQRQEKLLTFLQKSIENPIFVKHLTKKIESMDFSAYGKKRRLPAVHHCQISEDSFMDTHSSSRTDIGNAVIPQGVLNNLSLELSPAGSDINLVSHSTQSSNEEGAPPQSNVFEGDPKGALMIATCPLFTPETLELSDTGTSSKCKTKSSLQQKRVDGEGQFLLSLQQNVDTNENHDLTNLCHLNLTLASSSLQLSNSQPSSRMHLSNHDLEKISGSKSNPDTNEKDSTKEAEAPPPRVNDVFWEQFLTERPGSTDTEEASSTLRVKSPNEQERESKLGSEMFRNEKSMDQLTL